MDWNNILIAETDLYNRYDFRAEAWADEPEVEAVPVEPATEFEMEMPF